MQAPFVSVVLRCDGDSIDPDGLAAAFRGHQINQIWRRGELTRRGKKAQTSGLTVTVWEGPADDAWRGLSEALLRSQEAIAAANAAGASCELDFGVEHAVEAPTVSLKFEAALLKQVADLGVDLTVSDYLTNE